VFFELVADVLQTHNSLLETLSLAADGCDLGTVALVFSLTSLGNEWVMYWLFDMRPTI